MPERPLGLVLASGGARGAYQAGALKYLAEQGVRFTHVSGTSIGSLNGAFYAQGNGSPEHIEGLCELWRELPGLGLIQLNDRLAEQVLLHAAAFFTPTYLKWFNWLTKGKFHILDPGPMAELIRSRIDPIKIKESRKRFFVAALPSKGPITDPLLSPWLDPIYVRADTLPPEELWSLLIAAAAIPLAFPSQKVGDQELSDAALVASLATKPLYDDGCRDLFTIFLSEMTIQDRNDFPGATLFELRPSTPIDEQSIKSTLDFSLGHIEGLLKQGYEDCKATYSESQKIFNALIALDDSGNRMDESTKALGRRQPLMPSTLAGEGDIGFLPRDISPSIRNRQPEE